PGVEAPTLALQPGGQRRRRLAGGDVLVLSRRRTAPRLRGRHGRRSRPQRLGGDGVEGLRLDRPDAALAVRLVEEAAARGGAVEPGQEDLIAEAGRRAVPLREDLDTRVASGV